MFATGLIGLLYAALSVVAIIYTLVCVYSLYEKFKAEKFICFNLVSSVAKSYYEPPNVDNKQSDEIEQKPTVLYF